MVQFGYEVKKTFPGNALSRQLKEALLIDDHVGPRMNDKREWVRPASVRLRAERAQELFGLQSGMPSTWKKKIIESFRNKYFGFPKEIFEMILFSN